MKRIIKIFSFLVVLLLMGCSKEEYITCNIEVDNNNQNYKMTGVYKIYYDDSYVTKIEEQEEYISNDADIINYFYNSKDLEYCNLNDLYGGFTHIINNNERKLEINVTIDMNKVDIANMLKDNYLDENYVLSKKLTTSGIVKIYESKGAVCDI